MLFCKLWAGPSELRVWHHIYPYFFLFFSFQVSYPKITALSRIRFYPTHRRRWQRNPDEFRPEIVHWTLSRTVFFPPFYDYTQIQFIKLIKKRLIIYTSASSIEWSNSVCVFFTRERDDVRHNWYKRKTQNPMTSIEVSGQWLLYALAGRPLAVINLSHPCVHVGDYVM